jgi:hypothetical protein
MSLAYSKYQNFVHVQCFLPFRRLVGRQNDDSDSNVMVRKRCNEIEAGSKFVRVHTFNPRDSNTVVTNYYQVQIMPNFRAVFRKKTVAFYRFLANAI